MGIRKVRGDKRLAQTLRKRKRYRGLAGAMVMLVPSKLIEIPKIGSAEYGPAMIRFGNFLDGLKDRFVIGFKFGK